MPSPPHCRMPPEVKLLVRSAFGKFLLLDEGEETDNASRMHRLLHAMKREVLAPKEYLMHQGEEGSKMYVVIEGSLSVIIDGQVIRSIGRGAKVGELALLYNEPRSADVIADEQCVLYSIRREMFKEVQVRMLLWAFTGGGRSEVTYLLTFLCRCAHCRPWRVPPT
jgi:CRP-like cAMP-binding protein